MRSMILKKIIFGVDKVRRLHPVYQRNTLVPSYFSQPNLPWYSLIMFFLLYPRLPLPDGASSNSVNEKTTLISLSSWTCLSVQCSSCTNISLTTNIHPRTHCNKQVFPTSMRQLLRFSKLHLHFQHFAHLTVNIYLSYNSLVEEHRFSSLADLRYLLTKKFDIALFPLVFNFSCIWILLLILNLNPLKLNVKIHIPQMFSSH